MSSVIAWMAAEAERPEIPPGGETPWRSGDRRREEARQGEIDVRGLPAHQFPAKAPDVAANPSTASPSTANQGSSNQNAPLADEDLHSWTREEFDQDRQRRVYRSRAVSMLRRYMRYSLETGRLPSLLGREFFRSTVTKYRVTTFEDRVIFVHDMEICLGRLDEFSRQLIARHVLQEHDQAATSRLLGCSERTIRTSVPAALDLFCDILLEVGLLDQQVSNRQKSCQGGKNDQISASDWEDGKNKF